MEQDCHSESLRRQRIGIALSSDRCCCCRLPSSRLSPSPLAFRLLSIVIMILLCGGSPTDHGVSRYGIRAAAYVLMVIVGIAVLRFTGVSISRPAFCTLSFLKHRRSNHFGREEESEHLLRHESHRSKKSTEILSHSHLQAFPDLQWRYVTGILPLGTSLL